MTMPSLHAPTTPVVARRGLRGFTLLEVLTAVTLVALLASVALPVYSQYVIRGQLAQQLVNVDQIRSVLAVEVAGGRSGLEQGAQAGKAPPSLVGTLPERAFLGDEGIRLQLLRLPTAKADTGLIGEYGLAVDTPDANGLLRLRLFYREVEKAGFVAAWVSPQGFVFGLKVRDRQENGGSPTDPPPVGCPPGWTSVGGGNWCRPPSGEACPPGWVSAGQSGLCRPPSSSKVP